MYGTNYLVVPLSPASAVVVEFDLFDTRCAYNTLYSRHRVISVRSFDLIERIKCGWYYLPNWRWRYIQIGFCAHPVEALYSLHLGRTSAGQLVIMLFTTSCTWLLRKWWLYRPQDEKLTVHVTIGFGFISIAFRLSFNTLTSENTYTSIRKPVKSRLTRLKWFNFIFSRFYRWVISRIVRTHNAHTPRLHRHRQHDFRSILFPSRLPRPSPRHRRQRTG